MSRFYSIKRLNITFVFIEPLNHAFVVPDKMVEIFAGSGGKKEKHNSIQAPGLFVIRLLESKKEVVLEQNRIVLNDNSGQDPEKSNLPEFVKKVFNEVFVKWDNVSAEGYNYDIEITESEKVITPNIFLPEFLSKSFVKNGENISSSGIKTRIQAKDVRKEIQTETLSSSSIFFHINYHYAGKIAEDQKKRTGRFRENYKDAIKLTKKLKI